ncbi:MAG: TIGR00730 family Rossman fold protein [Gemmatimonadales bacterium]|nr:MAG: TIGR00730 family Rossman fold protein [Gemmatimonadales bacterium]
MTDPEKRLRHVCVFCGSSAGEDPRHLEAASALGRLLVRREITLIYGGSRMGLMGRLAQTVLDEGGRVVGVIPRVLLNREVAHTGLTELLVTDSMHERKTEMAARADGFIAAPGGLGTLEEFFEVLTWAQLGLHGKPCGLLDVNGYFEDLVRLLDRVRHEGFMQEAHRRMILVASNPSTLLDQMEIYVPPPVPQWIEEIHV